MLQLSIFCLSIPNSPFLAHSTKMGLSLFSFAIWHDVEPCQYRVMGKHWRKGFCFLVLVSSLSRLLQQGQLVYYQASAVWWLQQHLAPNAHAASQAPRSCSAGHFFSTQLLPLMWLPKHPASAVHCSQKHPEPSSLSWHPSQMACSGIFPMRHFPMISFFWNLRG